MEWAGDQGVDTAVHASYLDQMCDACYQGLSSQILNAVHVRGQLYEDPLLVEVAQHATLAKLRCKTFSGRQDVMAKIEDYFRGAGGRVYILILTAR